jgi:hypothetical protein
MLDANITTLVFSGLSCTTSPPQVATSCGSAVGMGLYGVVMCKEVHSVEPHFSELMVLDVAVLQHSITSFCSTTLSGQNDHNRCNVSQLVVQETNTRKSTFHPMTFLSKARDTIVGFGWYSY